MKRRKFAVAAAVGFAGLLTMAMTAVTISAADNPSPGTSLNKAWSQVKMGNHSGKGDSKNPTGKAMLVGHSTFTPSTRVSTQNHSSPTFAPQVNRAIPTKGNGALAPQPLSSYPTAPDLKINNPALDNPHTTLTLNSYDQFADTMPPPFSNFQLTPPDGGMGVSTSGQTVEAVNDVFRVYNGNPLSGQNNSESLYNFWYPALLFTGYDLPSDPEVTYDATGNRWVMTELAFSAGFFFPGPLGSAVFIAVSATSDATGVWNIYVLNTSQDGSITGCNIGFDFCLADQPRLGVSRWGIQITTNSFSETGPGFNGTQLYDLDKSAAYNNLPFVNTFYVDIGGTIPTPDPGGIWYSVEPAKWTPGSANLTDPIFGADQYYTSTYDFSGLSSDNRQEAWVTAGEQFLNQTGFPNGPFLLFAQYKTNSYATPPPGDQPFGNAPAFGCCEPINTNDDRMIYATLANPSGGKAPRVWAGQNTGVNVTGKNDVEHTSGVAVYDVNFGFPFSSPSVVNQQIIASSVAGVAFGSAAITLGNTHGGGIGYSIFGEDAGLYPSSAFSFVNPNRSQLAKSIQVSGLGADPLDEFAVRFGDYSSAVALGNVLYMESEMVQYPNCSQVPDPTCGGTRGPVTNWGTSITLVKDHSAAE